MAFLLCTITLVADAFQVQLAAEVPRPQHRTVNNNDPLAPDISQKYVHTTEKPQSSSHTECNKHWRLPGFSVLWYIDVMFGN